MSAVVAARPGLAWAVAGLALALAACAPRGGDATSSDEGFQPDYLGVETDPLDDDLVGFTLSMRGARGPQDLDDYARCAAAGYGLENGFGFLRHIRTKLAEEGGVWRADAVYTFSSALPEGVRTIDAEVTVADCADRGIPTAPDGRPRTD